MTNDTTRLLGLVGAEVLAVELDEHANPVPALVTGVEAARCCPERGTRCVHPQAHLGKGEDRRNPLAPIREPDEHIDDLDGLDLLGRADREPRLEPFAADIKQPAIPPTSGHRSTQSPPLNLYVQVMQLVRA